MKGLLSPASILYIGLALFLYAAMYTVLAPAISTGVGATDNFLAKALLISIPASILFFIIGSAFASEELSRLEEKRGAKR